MYNESFRCGVCVGFFNTECRKPLFLECAHTLCQECASKIVAGRKACPFCRGVVSKSISELLPNFALIAVLQQSGAMVLDKLENLDLPDLQYLVISPSRLTISNTVMSRVGASGNVMSGYLDGNHEVAVKMISLPNAGDYGDGVEGPASPAVATTLKKEMSVIVKVAQKCHFVCRYYGVSIKDNHFCLVMTKYPGSLKDHIAKHPGGNIGNSGKYGKLDLPSALRIALDILNGLKELHDLSIVVLDLKPDNILMTAHGTAVLTDFGISEIITTSTIGMVKQSHMAGTLNYM